MNVEEIRQLVKIVAESDIADLEITQWGHKVKISKYPGPAMPATPSNGVPVYFKEQAYSTTVIPLPAPATTAPVLTSVLAAPLEPAPPPAEKKNLIDIKSPMVGTFYRAPAPDAEPYVSEGSTIAKGQVLCIIEAMKLMNEIEAEFSCRIVEVLVQNAQPVEYNQLLFRAEKT